jgi:hypothetical protein
MIKQKFFSGMPAIALAFVLGLVLLFVSCQTTPAGSDSGISESGTLSSLLRAASVEIQKWDKGNERERDVTVYSFKPEITLDTLIQAIKDSGFYQVRSGEYTRDWDLQRGVLRWCVPADTEKWDRELQFSVAGERKVETYGFIPTPEVYWTAVTDSTFESGSEEGEGIRAIVYGGGKFVATGVYLDKNGTWKSEMAYSTDGITWTAVEDSSIPYRGTFGALAYGGGKFVTGGTDGRMIYSTDGIRWTAVEDSKLALGDYIEAIAYGGGRFVAGSIYNDRGVWRGRTAYSADGVTWTAGDTLNFEIKGIAYGGGRFVVGGSYNAGEGWRSRMAYSADGVTWTAITDNPIGDARAGMGTIAYGGGKFFAGTNNKRLAYSADGVTWTELDPDVQWDNIEDSIVRRLGGGLEIAYGAGKFVAGGAVGHTVYSVDGVTWRELKGAALDGNDINALAYGAGRFVVAGERGKIAYSNVQE